MNYQKFEKYYYLRYQQFEALTDAKDWFDEGEEQHMWYALIHYAYYMYHADQSFDSFDDKDIEALLNGHVPMFMLRITDEDIENS